MLVHFTYGGFSLWFSSFGALDGVFLNGAGRKGGSRLVGYLDSISAVLLLTLVGDRDKLLLTN